MPLNKIMNTRIVWKQPASFNRPFKANIRRSLLVAVVAGGLSSTFGATTNVVVVGGLGTYGFSPSVLSIQSGDKVIWNGLGTIHSVTSDTPPETLCGTTPVPGGSCTNIFGTPGTYLYHCINHCCPPFGHMTGVVNVATVALPLGVTITSPSGGSVFAEPANVKISASVTNNSGSVTNVQFFTNGVSLGSVSIAPFDVTTPLLSFGAYALTATASASTGLSATSVSVNIAVVTPVAVSNFFPRFTNGQFVFEHAANPGLRYAVENTTNFAAWSPVVTNTAVSNSVKVIDAFQLANLRFYRVGRLPNP
jgi:plastocyanin